MAGATTAYLARLGLDAGLPPTLETLVTLHRRHLERLPYENLAIMLGTPPSVDLRSCLERVGDVGRAGYCFHHNGALELVLDHLGFEVSRRHGHVWTDPADRDGLELNHLVLVVDGLPSDENPGGRWWVDVGLGDGFRDPLPVLVGTYEQGDFCYTIDDVRPDGWSFRHDPRGSFGGVEVSSVDVGPVAVLDAHARLSTPPAGRFTQLLVVQRRHATGVETLRGCVRTSEDALGHRELEVTTYDGWLAALGDLRVSLEGVDPAELAGLFDRSLAAHLAWRGADA